MSYYTCKWCKKGFYKIGNKPFVFCSKKCYGEYRISKRKLLECLTCGKKFFPTPRGKGKKAYFCSRICAFIPRRGSGYREKKTCLSCKKEFVVRTRSGSRRRQYCSQVCFYERNNGKTKSTKSSKYKKVYVVGKGNIWEHRHILEQNLGRPLKGWEIVHHINGNPSDNRIDNLMIVTPTEHLVYTKMQQIIEILKKENKKLKYEINKYK